MGNTKESQAGSVASVIIGAIMTYLSYLWVHENVEANKIILILTAPIAIVFLLIGICNLFPKFRGIVLIASGVIVGGGAYWLFKDFMAHVWEAMLVFGFIALVLVVVGFGFLSGTWKGGDV